MSQSKGFLLVQEIMIFTLSSMLLTISADSFAKGLSILERNNNLYQCMQVATYELLQEPYEINYTVTKNNVMFGDLILTEVNVANAEARFKLLWAVSSKKGIFFDRNCF